MRCSPTLRSGGSTAPRTSPRGRFCMCASPRAQRLPTRHRPPAGGDENKSRHRATGQPHATRARRSAAHRREGSASPWRYFPAHPGYSRSMSTARLGLAPTPPRQPPCSSRSPAQPPAAARTPPQVSTEIKLLLKRILVAQPHSRASFDAIASTLAAVAARGGSAAELAGMGLRRQPAGLGKTGDRSYSLLDLTTLEPT
eukprot:scaffold17815_cov112-Isochrysis_galbana.AAC.1